MRTSTPARETGQASLPLAGFYRLYESQLRAERKSAKTIKNYNEALGKFKRWFEEAYGRPPALADLNVVEVRLFLGDALGRRKYEGTPPWRGRPRTRSR